MAWSCTRILCASCIFREIILSKTGIEFRRNSKAARRFWAYCDLNEK
jgi:hypothetical protein